jgi:BMFP domain-containing protein YqiC
MSYTQFEEIAKHLTDILPKDLKILSADLEKNFCSILESSFSKMNLVTREEFDIQSAVLARTRAQLQTLEQKLKEIEKHI